MEKIFPSILHDIYLSAEIGAFADDGSNIIMDNDWMEHSKKSAKPKKIEMLVR